MRSSHLVHLSYAEGRSVVSSPQFSFTMARLRIVEARRNIVELLWRAMEPRALILFTRSCSELEIKTNRINGRDEASDLLLGANI